MLTHRTLIVGCAVLLGMVSSCVPTVPAGESTAVSREPASDELFFTGLTQLTFGGQNAEAYFSGDGTQLIFQRTEGEACDQQYIMKLDGSDMTRVSNGLGRTTCGYFYAGDDRVVYSSTYLANEACPAPPDRSRGYVWPIDEFEVFTSRPDGSGLQQLTDSPGYDAEATLSPDGQTIVFTSTRDGDIDIYTMNVDGSSVRRLTTTLGYDGGPFFSPDGSQIVYRAGRPQTDEEIADYRSLLDEGLVRPSEMELWMMNADGTDQRQITNLGGANFAPYFHPDGGRIIFSSNHHEPAGSRDFDLFLIGVDGDNLVQVTTSDLFDGFPMFSPDGSKLVFAANRHGEAEGETNIFIAEWSER